MKILLINKYLYPRGGDAVVTLDTGSLLSLRGHEVIFWGMTHPSNPRYPYEKYFVSNVDFDGRKSVIQRLKIASNILYSLEAKKKIDELVRAEKPDLVHLNNFAHQISPSILDVFRKYKIPAVMTMHDYKLVCASYQMLSKNKICELCRGGKYYHCFLEGCVKDSKTKSFLNTVEMYLHHKMLHLYDLINIFISPSIFLKDKLEDMGFKGKIVYLPYFIDPNAFEPQYTGQENLILYFGRLSKEKGLFTLIQAVRDIPKIKLNIVGTGPIEDSLKEKVKDENIKNVCFLGYKTGNELKNEIRKSMFVIVPSEWYENYPRAIMEAFALGKPVIGANMGGIPELVKDKKTGLTFESGNSEELRAKIQYMFDHPQAVVEMGKNARKFVEQELNAEAHYQNLLNIYEQAIRQNR